MEPVKECGKHDPSTHEPFQDLSQDVLGTILRLVQVSVCKERELQATRLKDAVGADDSDFYYNNADWVKQCFLNGLLSPEDTQWLRAVQFSGETIHHIRQRSNKRIDANNASVYGVIDEEVEERKMIIADVKQCIILNQVVLIGRHACVCG